MRTIAVIARKGGSGKTTVAVHLAIAAHLRGRRTLLADSDPQCSSSTVLKGRRAPGPSYNETSGPKLFALQVSALRDGFDTLVVDTPAGAEDELAHAIVLADLSLLVIRPTFLDFAAAIRTADVLRRLHKPGLIVLNQAPVSRAGAEPPLVKKAHEALRLMRLPVAPTIVRSRAAYQTALETGCSAEELSGAAIASQEIADLWCYVERLTYGAPQTRLRA
ncbi:MAG TPA: ParA family protein [Caulobacteraceae bacterium]|jgi:chromosome partitioning protein|nr:ParA family protein [Caulobacteraceae bacterium]